MNSKLVLAFGVLACFAVVGLEATSAADKARAAAEAAKDAALDYVKHAVKDAMHDDPDTLLDKAKHAVRDAAGNIIGGTLKSSGKAAVGAGAAKMAYNAARNIKERVWDDDDDESDPEQRARNDRLRKSCKSRSSSRAAAEECYKDAKEWNEIESEVDANGPSVFSRMRQSVEGAYSGAKDYVTGDKEHEKKKGWL